MIGQLYHLGKNKSRTRAGELLITFDLADAGSRRVKTYSGGMPAASGFSGDAGGRAEDTVSGWTDYRIGPPQQIRVMGRDRQTDQRLPHGILTTQYLEEADRLADKIAIMESGHIIQVGTPAELKGCCGGENARQIETGGPESNQTGIRIAAGTRQRPDEQYCRNRRYQLTGGRRHRRFIRCGTAAGCGRHPTGGIGTDPADSGWCLSGNYRPRGGERCRYEKPK